MALRGSLRVANRSRWLMPGDEAARDAAGIIAQRLDAPVAAAVERAAAHLTNALSGDRVVAILAYGSCIRETDPRDGLLDLYVVVSDYSVLHRGRMRRALTRILPPDVFYDAVPLVEGPIRVKYAVIAIDDFERGLARAFLPYLWGRFAQPARLVWVRDSRVRERLLSGLQRSVARLLATTCPLAPDPVTPDALWTKALSLSYGTELRPESPARAGRIVARDADYYDRLTSALVAAGELELVPQAGQPSYRPLASRRQRLRAGTAWLLRRWLGRVVAIARLAKASFTFRGGVDYAAWKIERHTGTAIQVTPRLRRYPLIYGWGVLWRLLRQRLVR
jgi:hypothetical protein